MTLHPCHSSGLRVRACLRSPLMGGDWDLAWTSEKEVSFLMEKGLFGDK